MGLKVPGDTMVFWWPAGTDPDTYDADHGRAMDMAVARYPELYGEAPEAEIIGKLAMVSDLELEGDGEALLLRSNGSVVGRGTTAINWIANPGTPYCEWDAPPPGVNETCLTCQYGNPNGPGGVWSVSTCFAY